MSFTCTPGGARSLPPLSVEFLNIVRRDAGLVEPVTVEMVPELAGVALMLPFLRRDPLGGYMGCSIGAIGNQFIFKLRINPTFKMDGEAAPVRLIDATGKQFDLFCRLREE